jgi:hypothetical protein
MGKSPQQHRPPSSSGKGKRPPGPEAHTGSLSASSPPVRQPPVARQCGVRPGVPLSRSKESGEIFAPAQGLHAAARSVKTNVGSGLHAAARSVRPTVGLHRRGIGHGVDIRRPVRSSCHPHEGASRSCCPSRNFYTQLRVMAPVVVVWNDTVRVHAFSVVGWVRLGMLYDRSQCVCRPLSLLFVIPVPVAQPSPWAPFPRCWTGTGEWADKRLLTGDAMLTILGMRPCDPCFRARDGTNQETIAHRRSGGCAPMDGDWPTERADHGGVSDSLQSVVLLYSGCTTVTVRAAACKVLDTMTTKHVLRVALLPRVRG